MHALTNGATSKTWQLRANARPTPVTAVFGHSFDANADGYSDMAYLWTTDEYVPKLLLYTYYGGPSGLPQAPSRADEIPPGPLWIGGATNVGDVNGDGYPDLMFHACSSGTNCEYDLHEGGADGLSTSVSTRFAILDEADTTEDVLSEVGDVNGDGYADVAVGTPKWNAGEGRVLVYFGSDSGLSVATPQVLVGANFSAIISSVCRSMRPVM